MSDEDRIVIENAHDPIVDTKTFAYAAEQLILRSKTIIVARRNMPPIIPSF